jgi:V8-like Glu-specific endopeptidase
MIDSKYEFGYNQYVGKDIYILQHPQGKSTHVASGKILKITNTIEFNHNADTDYGSSGSPVILFSNNKVIGIHKKRGSGNYNEGTFIGELIEGLSKEY